MSIEDILRFNNARLGDGTSIDSPEDRIMVDFDPQTAPEDKEKFYMRVRSKIIAQSIEGFVDQESWNILMSKKEKFSWTDSCGDVL